MLVATKYCVGCRSSTVAQACERYFAATTGYAGLRALSLITYYFADRVCNARRCDGL